MAADNMEFSEKLENLTVHNENGQYQIDFIMEYYNYFFGDFNVRNFEQFLGPWIELNFD